MSLETPGFTGTTNPADTATISDALAGASQDAEEAQPGGADNSNFERLLGQLESNFKLAQENNVRLQILMTVEGTALKAAGKEPNSK